LLAVSIVGLWASLPLAIIILSAGLQGIPAELYAAAQLDGAGTLRQFFAVTVPLLTPSIFFLTIITAINGFQLFDLLFAMMGQANPAMADTQSLVYLFYSEAFRQNDQGYASVIALLILAIIGVFTLLQFRMQRRWVHYARDAHDGPFPVPPTWFPAEPQWGNYPAVFEQVPFWNQFLNTAAVTIARVLGQLLLCALAGYAFARMTFRGKNVLFALVLSILMVPYQIYLIPQ